MADYSSWKVADLKAELKNRGIPQTGLRLKQQFIDKLEEEDAKAQPKDTVASAPETDTQQDRAAEPTLSAPGPQKEEPQHEQAPTETRQPEAPDTEKQPQVEPTPENAPDEIAEAQAHRDEPRDQPPAGEHKQPIEKEVPEAVPEGKSPATEKPIEQAPENLPTERPIETPALPISEANTELSTPLPVEELLEDKRKRKRRSQSPVPTPEAIANKKARAQEEVPLVEDQEGPKDTTQEQPVPVPAEGSPEPVKQNAQLRGLLASTEAAAAQSSTEARDIVMEDAVVEPALHSATSSLYIDGLMRPMNVTSLKNHLIELATGSGAAPDPGVVSEFYLDPIRTHCFVQFAAVAAAVRARSAIHGTVWPAERNRKKLWADFIPDDQVKAFIETEDASRDRAGRPVRWEVRYDHTDDGMTAALIEADSHPKAERGREAEFKRTPPAGPRGSVAQERRPSHAPPPPPSRPGQGFKPLDELFESTTVKPKLYYLPVPRKVADKRLDQFDELLQKGTFARRGGDEMRRITFENDDYFVDAGPEYGARTLAQRQQGRGGRPGDSRRGR
ncbi:hypothetical protein N7492_000301 [Penicillium capsulatum]|uniref:SAP domain-containing protein n=1 Tax=Penicillium capsulatum TaxID=69766 RepID=A0A9W9IT97_9EURO|nr:hypothetical protein N7492_000301 [Penicillium capsulatum]KAJ6130635.1 hypothetical protein N7512_003415 [Penicillium capsulatum]